jgi:hypothetical protein
MSKKPSIIAAALGQLGGRATQKKYGADHFKRISKLAVEARRAKAKARKENNI